MDSLLEKLTDLKLNKEETKEVPKPVKKTCFLNDAKLSGQNEPLISSISKLIPNTQGRLLNEKESLKLNNLLNNVLLSEQDSYTLGSSCELVSQVLTNGFENGIMFVDRKLDMLKSEDESNSYESLLLDLLFNRYSLRRVLLLNFDRNANKSIEKRFYNDSRLLKVSINSKRSEESSFDRIGAESGIGFNVNVELKDESYQNSDFMSVFHNLVLPIAYEFNPELILISTCFDAIDKSLNAETLLTPSIYAHYLHSLSCLANGKICLLIDSSRQNTNTNLIDCSLASAKTLLNKQCPRFSNGLVAPKLSTIECILNLTTVLRAHWCGLQLFNEDDENTSVEDFIQMQKIDNKYFDFSAQIKEEKKEKSENSEVTQLGDVLDSLSLTENRTCLCTDERMMLHYNLTSPSHPERPDRIKFIIERLKEKSLFQRCTSLSPRSVTDEELHYCHETEYIESLKTLNSKTNEELIEMSCNRDSVYYNKDTFESAALATGCLLNVVDQVCTKKHLNGVAVCRPPGHHAYPDSCSGFCFFNSVGIAVRYAQKKYPSTVKKVLILDFDVHHGNGTQEIFKEDDSVLFISLHRYDDGHFYPANSDSNYDCVGEGKGVGFTVNIPWNQPQSGDAEYTAAFLRIVMPVAYQFNPDLVFVSAGFDAALGDPLGGYKVTPVGYAQMTKMLCSLANGNVIMALEGGYNLNSISESMSSCVSMLLGDQCPAQISTIPKPLAFKSMRNVTNTLKAFWSCFKFDVKLPDCEFVKKPKWEVRAKKQNDLMYGLRTRIKKNEASPNGSSSSCSSTPTRSSRTPTTNDANEQVRRSPRLVARSSPKPSTTTPRRAVKTTETPIKSEASSETVPQEVKQEESQSNPVASPEVSEAGAGAAVGGLIQSLQSVTPLEIVVDGVSSYAVVPLTYCPHLLEISTSNDLSRVNATLPCSACQDPTENWICLTCLQIFCSRYVRGHMAEHFESSAHAMTLSFSDLSVWCYVCDSYVDNSRLDSFKQAAYVTKFPN